MRESVVVNKVKEHAKQRGFLHRKVVYVGRRGAPDDWFFGSGARLIMIEFKAPGEMPEPHQQREIDRLRSLGHEVYVIDDIATGKRIFDDAVS